MPGCDADYSSISSRYGISSRLAAARLARTPQVFGLQSYAGHGVLC
jgi:hypothetical protein